MLVKMQEHEQQIVDPRIFPQEVAQWFTPSVQQTSIIYTSQPSTVIQQQNDRMLQIPVGERSVSCETTDVTFVSNIMQPLPLQNDHPTLEAPHISMENLTQNSQVHSNDFLSLVVVEPKIKDAATNTEEKWGSKRFPVKKTVSRLDNMDLKSKPELLTPNQRFHCLTCLRDFSNITLLMSHKCHQTQADLLNCGKKFSKSACSTVNNFVEKNPQPLVCQVCNIYFSNEQVFLNHQESHEVSSRYSCDVNQRQEFREMKELKRHDGLHKTQHICSVCKESFESNSLLISHKRIHSSDRPYQCDVCHKRFFTKSHVQNHRRVHSGERPFVCNVCGRAFAESSSYRRHERLHQQNKKYRCEVCGRGFALAVSLSKHLAKLHAYS
ncbi:unnamed protein product [Bemisia tabaci]|uniref:C2H2-type domain-containing protein n=1 Tax=Bemisia tabaci TaxID=7038 RepID=A0A9P0A4J1_BEMTA|nr:unnamed protein product [Bemisia tabaci]